MTALFLNFNSVHSGESGHGIADITTYAEALATENLIGLEVADADRL